MAWRVDEVWLDTDLLWFRERPFGELALAVPALADVLEPPSWLAGRRPDALRARRLARQAERRRRLATRTVPAVALVLGSATMLPIAAVRQGWGAQDAGPLEAEPPSLTFRLGDRFALAEAAFPRPRPSRQPSVRTHARAVEFASVDWRHATAVGLPWSGRLDDGTQLPVEGPDWVTWNPNTDSVPNQPHRLYGHERTIRTILSVLAAYRIAHPDAARVVVGDIAFRDGGQMDGHVSHQNGLDVDVYYPRRDRHLSAPIATSQIEHELAQDLVDRFVAVGAQFVFVGYSTGLRGPSGVVVPYPNHENHMHVRFPAPG
jgi:Penicillin-insensitive murein endopeptidase